MAFPGAGRAVASLCDIGARAGALWLFTGLLLVLEVQHLP